MNENDKQEDEKLENRRRPYVKPAIVTDEAFETMALSCARADVTCGFGPIKS